MLESGKLMRQDIELVVRVQRLDLRAAELEKEIAALPKYLAGIERTLEAHQRKLEADKTILAANQKERRQVESDVQVQQQKISKLRDQMMSAKTNEQYRAFQHEIQYCEESISKHEDRIIELMLQAEALEANVKQTEAALAREKEQVAKELVRARELAARDKEELDKNRAERAGAIAQVNAPLVALYEKCRKRHHGIAVSDATNGRCSACHLDIRPAMFQQLRTSDEVLVCENCGRILYYNPPVSFENEVAASPQPQGHGTRVDMT
jgi:uncharacterized protein